MRILTLFISCLLLGCKNPAPKENVLKATMQEQTKKMEKDSITREGLEKLTLTEARGRYERPLTQETFVLGIDPLHEFRGGLLNVFSKGEINSKTIHVKEVTWEKDEEHNITVWYRQEGEIWTPVDIFEWNKDDIF
ncbi:hypothetical protein ED312_15420 [Sinomicrobium pectinilyticum]|uniref:Lipoprotein n=1 Tax=Sinomicrobium pectinilyticum TaxID=1084421 RepID=A0A3N0E5Z6_SINP1|nr:hypothetical protein [Sinomicrobium pectinilyticum]RNL83271.1 hypothetical protein ED312_15420 [Sinomicrobium pectinilyticum]